MSEVSDKFFAPIVDRAAAAKAVLPAVLVLAALAVLRGLVLLLAQDLPGVRPTNTWAAIADVAALALLSYGIYRLSRIAACVALIYYFGSSVVGPHGAIWLVVLITLPLVRAVHATFSYRRRGGANAAAA
jgi:hypothetical protein